jgi:hypothetical protein
MSRLVVYGPNEMIITMGRIGDCMYILNKGRAQVERLGDDGRIFVNQVLKEGQYFGERGLLFASKRDASVRTLCFVEVSVLTRESIEVIMTDFPNVRRVVRQSMIKELIWRKIANKQLLKLAEKTEKRVYAELKGTEDKEKAAVAGHLDTSIVSTQMEQMMRVQQEQTVLIQTLQDQVEILTQMLITRKKSKRYLKAHNEEEHEQTT